MCEAESHAASLPTLFLYLFLTAPFIVRTAIIPLRTSAPISAVAATCSSIAVPGADKLASNASISVCNSPVKLP